MRPHVEAGRLRVIGIVQEQHPDRARLYRQWRALEWPVAVDALNRLDHAVVPIPMLLDARGVVVAARLRGPDELATLLADEPAGGRAPGPPALHPLAGDDAFLAGELDRAIDAYRGPAARDDARALFRLGVALRRRFESGARRDGDGQAAIDAWTRALALEPGRYVWRRRLQQYGPVLDKPYDMYGWIDRARAAIRARGDEPVPLAVEPRGSELRGRGGIVAVRLAGDDPAEGLPPDAEGLVRVETIVTPPRVRPGARVRVRLELTPRGWWNNESPPVALWADPPPGLSVAGGDLSYPVPDAVETREPRVLELEIAVDPDAGPGARALGGSLTYSVCGDEGGVCRLLRRDWRVRIVVDRDAPALGR